MKKSVRLIALLVALVCTLSLFGCAENTGEGNNGDLPPIPSNVDVWAPYDETVTVKLCAPGNMIEEWPGSVTGDTGYGNNVWTQTWLDEFNIKTELMWEAHDASGAYSTRLSLAIVSDALPDIIYTSDYAQFTKLQQAGKLRELGEYKDAYAYDLVKKYMDASGESLERGMVNGKLYGLARSSDERRTRQIYIRADWMNELNLSAPKTMDDVIAIGKKFVESKKATYALPLYKLTHNGMGDIQAVANSMGGYPFAWLDDGNGGLKYGTIQPEMKEVFSLYADLCRQGFIDKAFASQDSSALAAQYTSDKIGVIPADSWILTMPLNSMWNEKRHIDWNIYPVMPMSSFTGEFKIQASESSTKFVCVNKSYKYPEVLFKLINHQTAMLVDPERADTETFYSTTIDEKTYTFHTMSPLSIYYNDPLANYNIQKQVTQAIDTGDKSVLASSTAKVQYNNVSVFRRAREQGNFGNGSVWSMYRTYYGDDSAYGVYNKQYIDKDLYMFDPLGGYQSATMVRQWSTLRVTEDTFIAEVISGKKPISEFDKFVTDWLAQGGDKVTQEVSEWYKGKSAN